jgi:hypothetical protein
MPSVVKSPTVSGSLPAGTDRHLAREMAFLTRRLLSEIETGNAAGAPRVLPGLLASALARPVDGCLPVRLVDPSRFCLEQKDQHVGQVPPR